MTATAHDQNSFGVSSLSADFLDEEALPHFVFWYPLLFPNHRFLIKIAALFVAFGRVGNVGSLFLFRGHFHLHPSDSRVVSVGKTLGNVDTPGLDSSQMRRISYDSIAFRIDFSSTSFADRNSAGSALRSSRCSLWRTPMITTLIRLTLMYFLPSAWSVPGSWNRNSLDVVQSSSPTRTKHYKRAPIHAETTESAPCSLRVGRTASVVFARITGVGIPGSVWDQRIKIFGQHCPEIVVTSDRDEADYVVLFGPMKSYGAQKDLFLCNVSGKFKARYINHLPARKRRGFWASLPKFGSGKREGCFKEKAAAHRPTVPI